jgi:serpin B
MEITRRDALRLIAVLSAVLGAPLSVGACDANGRTDGGVMPDPGLDLVSSAKDRSAGLVAAMPSAVRSIGAVGAGVYAALAGAAGNIALSPYSIVVALAMTLNGADGVTARELRTVLGVDDLDEFNGGLNALTQYVEGLAGSRRRGDGSEAELVLSPANAIFGQQETDWEQPFLDVLATDYGAGMRQVDFVDDPEEARGLINGWTAEQTRDRIPTILPEGSLDAMTRLVLVNAIYLKAPWEEPFFASATATAPFTTDDGRRVEVAMMSAGLSGSGHARGQGWESVRLNYAGGELAMTIVLPETGQLSAVSSLVASGGLADILSASQDERVHLSLPTWEFRSQAMLAPVLSALGMPTAFDPTRADFSGITRGEDLHVSAVVHEAFIAVDEEGTEAAAATAAVAGTTSLPAYVDVVVDRAFLFVIHDVVHGTPLFLGRVGDPAA